MTLLNRKVKWTVAFFACWLGLMTFLLDGLGLYQDVRVIFDSSLALEILLWAIVLIPTAMVFLLTKNR